MADIQAPKPKKDNVFTRKIGPLPMWGWVAIVGGGVIIYAIWANKNSQQSQPPGNAVAPPLVITTPPQQGAPGDDDDDDKKGKHHHKKHRKVNPGGPNKKREGPEREWLERKTGSEHPWTYLEEHHEQVRVGPRGSRTIVRDKR